jgi:hypothetical protein
MYVAGDFSREGLEVPLNAADIQRQCRQVTNSNHPFGADLNCHLTVIVEEDHLDLESGLLLVEPRICKEKCWITLVYFLIGLNILGLIGVIVAFILWLVLQK